MGFRFALWSCVAQELMDDLFGDEPSEWDFLMTGKNGGPFVALDGTTVVHGHSCRKTSGAIISKWIETVNAWNEVHADLVLHPGDVERWLDGGANRTADMIDPHDPPMGIRKVPRNRELAVELRARLHLLEELCDSLRIIRPAEHGLVEGVRSMESVASKLVVRELFDTGSPVIPVPVGHAPTPIPSRKVPREAEKTLVRTPVDVFDERIDEKASDEVLRLGKRKKRKPSKIEELKPLDKFTR